MFLCACACVCTCVCVFMCVLACMDVWLQTTFFGNIILLVSLCLPHQHSCCWTTTPFPVTKNTSVRKCNYPYFNEAACRNISLQLLMLCYTFVKQRQNKGCFMCIFASENHHSCQVEQRVAHPWRNCVVQWPNQSQPHLIFSSAASLEWCKTSCSWCCIPPGYGDRNRLNQESWVEIVLHNHITLYIQAGSLLMCFPES